MSDSEFDLAGANEMSLTPESVDFAWLGILPPLSNRKKLLLTVSRSPGLKITA